jgi:hypothetical protein
LQQLQSIVHGDRRRATPAGADGGGGARGEGAAGGEQTLDDSLQVGVTRAGGRLCWGWNLQQYVRSS